jgi:tetratricopeptide (TPR) repeat protein
MSVEYDVFLDESGRFDEKVGDKNTSSLVGGFFSLRGALSKDEAYSILEDANKQIGIKWDRNSDHHACDHIAKDKLHAFVRHLLESLIKKGGRPLIFENKEKVHVVDPDKTYLNLMAEGIARLFEKEKRDNDSLSLDIYPEMKMAAEHNYNQDLRKEEYMPRLQESIMMVVMRQGLLSITDLNWKVIIGRKKDPRIMICDVICHAWYSQKHSSIDPIEKSIAKKLIQGSGYVFSFSEHGITAKVESLINEKSFGSAIMSICVSMLEIAESEKAQDTHFNHIREIMKRLTINITGQLSILPSHERDRHFDYLVESLNYYANEIRSLQPAIKMCDYILDKIVFELERSLPSTELYSLTVLKAKIYKVLIDAYNHQGNTVDASKIIYKVDKAIQEIAKRFDSNLFLYFEIIFRKCVFMHNNFDFFGAVELMNELENKVEQARQGFFINQQINGKTKSDLIGKVYGNRLQSYCFLGRTDPKYYQKAREDSDKALEEFELFDDLSRHYLYRCHIESDDGKLENAISYLAMGINVDSEGKDINVLIEDIAGALIGINQMPGLDFALAHFVRIMHRAQELGQYALANQMHGLWQDYDQAIQVRLKGRPYHPVEILYWKLGSFHLMRGNVDEGLVEHQKALDICMLKNKNYTLRAIGMGILFEQAALLMKAGARVEIVKKALQSAESAYDEIFQKDNLPESYLSFFNDWKSTVGLIDISSGSRADIEILANELESLSYKIPF